MSDISLPDGKFHLIIGPMFAGKTTELFRLANRLRIKNRKILFINHTLNDRSGTNQRLCTHDHLSSSKISSQLHTQEVCVASNNLSSISNHLISQHDVIIIDEIQFFHDVDLILNWKKNGS